MADVIGWISSVSVDPGAVVTLMDQYPTVNKYTMLVSQSGTTQSLTWQDGKLAIDDSAIGADTTWSSQKISKLESPPEVNIGTTTPTNAEKIWINLNGSSGGDEYCVRFDIAQSLTAAEQLQARTNIGVIDNKEVTISSSEPTIDKTSIWINPNGIITDEYCVRFDITQSLTAAEQERARRNINADYEARIAALETGLADLKTRLGI